MLTRDQLLQAVEVEFDRTSAGAQGWANPHVDRGVTQDEYSRCLDPGKWRILVARTEAWADALRRLGLARVERVKVVDWVDEHHAAQEWDVLERLTPLNAGVRRRVRDGAAILSLCADEESRAHNSPSSRAVMGSLRLSRSSSARRLSCLAFAHWSHAPVRHRLRPSSLKVVQLPWSQARCRRLASRLRSGVVSSVVPTVSQGAAACLPRAAA